MVMNNQGKLVRYKDGLTPVQRTFHNDRPDGQGNGFRYRLLSGAVGSGKTTPGCMESIFLSRTCPGIVGVIFRSTFPQLRDSTQKTFFDILGWSGYQEKVHYTFRKTDNVFTWLHNGSQIWFRHLDKISDLKSTYFGFAFVDEITETPWLVWQMLSPGRMRQVGNYPRCVFAATNPDAESHWVYQTWWPNGQDNPCPHDYQAYQSSTLDNPHLPADYIEDLNRSEGSDWHIRYVLGKWGVFRGQVFKGFTDANIIGADDIIPRMKKLYIGLDWGYSNSPTAVGLIGLSGDGEAWVLDEIYETGLFVSDVRGGPCLTRMIRRMIAHEQKRSADGLVLPHFNYAYCDPEDPQAIDELRAAKIRAIGAQNRVLPGIMALDQWFYPIGTPPKLHFHPRCKNIIADMRGLRWAEDGRSGQITEKFDPNSRLHGADLMRYWAYSSKLEPPTKRPKYVSYRVQRRRGV